MKFRQLLRHFVIDNKIEKTHTVLQYKSFGDYWFDHPKAEEIVHCTDKEDLKNKERWYG